MKKYVFENVKYNSDNASFNSNIILCDDYRSSYLNVPLDLHTHDFYEILYVFSGEGVSIHNEQSYLLSHGSITFCKPGDIHTYFSTNNLAIANLCFIPNQFQTQLLKTSQTAFTNLLQDEQYEFEMLYSLLNMRLKNNYKVNEEIPNNYLNLIIEIFLNNSTQHNSTFDFWNNLLYYISQNYSTVTSNEAARICNLSESSFYRNFKKEFKQTFTQYLDRIKLEKAKKILIETNTNINDIAYCVGFSHPTRFYRYFKAIENTTPLKYKKAHQLYNCEP